MSSLLRLERQIKYFLNHLEFVYYFFFLMHLELKRQIRSYTSVVPSLKNYTRFQTKMDKMYYPTPPPWLGNRRPPCQQSRSFAWSILAYSRKTLHLFMNWVRCFLSMPGMLIGHRPIRDVLLLAKEGAVVTVSLSINERSHSKTQFHYRETRLTSPEFRAAVASKAWLLA